MGCTSSRSIAPSPDVPKDPLDDAEEKLSPIRACSLDPGAPSGSTSTPMVVDPGPLKLAHITQRYMLIEKSSDRGGRLLGKGSFGEVLLGWRILERNPNESLVAWESRCKAGQRYAIKRVRPMPTTVSKLLAKATTPMMGVLKAKSKFLSSRRIFLVGPEEGGELSGVPPLTPTSTPSPCPPAVAVLSPPPPSNPNPFHSLHRIRDRHAVRQEAEILEALGAQGGSDNVVRFVEHVEDERFVYIVMELVDGGDLLSYIRGVKDLREGVVAALFAQILQGVLFMHSRGVCHRDLKPENFLVVKGEGGVRVCVCDFGLAARVPTPHHRLHECVGTPYYQAPEMVAQTLPNPAAAAAAAVPGYTLAVDAWSLGVTLHLLLSGTLPFGGPGGPTAVTTIKDLREAICTQPLSLASQPWPGVSSGAKDLVMGLLEKDPSRRYTVEQCLAHRWLAAGVGGGRRMGVPTSSSSSSSSSFSSTDITSDVPISSAVVRSLVAFTSADRLRSRALRAVADSLSATEAATLRQQFFSMDLNGDTSLSHAELAHALARMGLKVAGGEVARLVAAMDTDGDGKIDLEEFLSATAELAMLKHRDTAVRAFARFDRNGDGVISLQEVRQALKWGGVGGVREAGGDEQQEAEGLEQDDLSDEYLEGLMKQYDKGATGSLSFADFWCMLYPSLPIPRE